MSRTFLSKYSSIKITTFFYLSIFLGFYISDKLSVYSLRLLSFLPFVLYFAFDLTKYHEKVFKNKIFWLLLFIYFILHARGFYVYNHKYLFAIGIFAQLFIVAILIAYKTRKELLLGIDYLAKQLYLGLCITFFIVTLIPNNIYGEFALGGHYNLGDQFSNVVMPFISSTLDSPILCSLTFIFSAIILLNRNKHKESWKKPKYIYVVIVFLILSALELLLMNRKGQLLLLF